MDEDEPFGLVERQPIVLPFGLRLDEASAQNAIGCWKMITMPDRYGRQIPVGPCRIFDARLIEEDGVTYLEAMFEVGPDVAHYARDEIRALLHDAEEHDTDG